MRQSPEPILAATWSLLGHVLLMLGMVAKVLRTKRKHGNIDEFLDAELFNRCFKLLARIDAQCW